MDSLVKKITSNPKHKNKTKKQIFDCLTVVTKKFNLTYGEVLKIVTELSWKNIVEFKSDKSSNTIELIEEINKEYNFEEGPFRENWDKIAKKKNQGKSPTHIVIGRVKIPDGFSTEETKTEIKRISRQTKIPVIFL